MAVAAWIVYVSFHFVLVPAWFAWRYQRSPYVLRWLPRNGYDLGESAYGLLLAGYSVALLLGPPTEPRWTVLALTPAAGAGIKYAVEDAVVAANTLAEPLKSGELELRDLAQVQRQREWPTRFIQALSAVAVKRILRFVRSKGPPRFPLLAWLLIRTPLLRFVAPRIVAFGLWRVHVETPEDSLNAS